MKLLELKNITKKFGTFTAVDEISFSVNEGEIFGFLGPNGAGKTTTISMLVTLLQPTSGTALIAGKDILKEKDEVRKQIGVVFQDQSVDEELTAYENLIFHGVMYDLDSDVMEKRITELLNLFDLHKRKNDLVKSFSGGMKRRLEIARGLLHHPKILFLDEPTIGLDPQTRNIIWKYLQKLNQEEKITIILTTHYMDEAEKLTNKIAIIDHGKIIAIDTPEKLKESLQGDIVSLKCNHPSNVMKKLAGLRWINKVKAHDGTVDITMTKAEEKIPLLLHELDKYNITINSISVHKPTLEDIFINFTGKTIREQEASAKETMRLNRKMWRR